jgi:WXXGXW repeat (2 copies)
MFSRTYFPLIVGGCGLVLLLSLPLPAEPPAPAPDGVDVLGRGPVHEAYAQPADARPVPGPVVPKEPPALIDEIPPDQKPAGDNVQWVPGYWQWDDDRKDFIWVSGFWRAAPPGRQWVPGHYQKGDDGWQWVQGYWVAAAQTEESLLPPPPEPLDAGPSVPASSDDDVYVPGTWVYRETRYRWRPGFYLDYRPGWVWNPAHFVWTPAGCIFVEGYWDYPLADRGLLFAPVVIDRRILEPNWCFTPTYAVAPDFLPCALFARPSWGHYYFGDYFDEGYSRRGFVPWIDARVGRHYRDPLYEYERRAYRGREGWERDLRASYAGRFEGDIPRPPRDLVQQNRYVKNVTVNSTTVDNSVHVNKTVHLFQNVTPLAPLNRIDSHLVKLATVDAGERKVFAEHVGRVRDLARQRQEQETRLASDPSAPAHRGGAPRAVKLELPPTVGPKNIGKSPEPLVNDRPSRTPPRTMPAPEHPTLPSKKDPAHDSPAPRHENPPQPPTKHEPPPTPKHELPPLPTKHEPPPSRHENPPAPPARHEPPASPKHDVPPPPPKHETPPQPKHETPAAPPPAKHDAPPKHEAPVPPPKNAVPPSPAKHDTPPPPKHEAPMPPPPKHEAPPPPPSPQHEPPPAPKREAPPPPPPPRHDPPPPPPKPQAPPPPPPRHDPPAPKHEPPPPPPPKHEAPPPPKHEPPPPPKPAAPPPPPPPKREAPPPPPKPQAPPPPPPRHDPPPPKQAAPPPPPPKREPPPPPKHEPPKQDPKKH